MTVAQLKSAMNDAKQMDCFTAPSKRFATTVRMTAVLLFFVAWVFYFYPVYLDPNSFLPRDNGQWNFPFFQFIAGHFKFSGQFPEWFYPTGTSLVPFTNNFLILLPHRLLGMAWFSVSDLPINFIYKVSFLIFGQGIFLLGCCWSGFLLFRSKILATLMGVLIFTSGIGVAFIHQEQSLGTLFFVPWVIVAILLAKKNPSLWIFAGSLMGLSFNNHYPQVLIAYYGLLFTFLLFQKSYHNLIFSRWSLYAIAALLVSASPLIYTYLTYADQMVSPFRGQGNGIFSIDYAQYLRMSQLQHSSLRPEDLKLYLLNGWVTPKLLTYLDSNLFFAGHLLVPALMIGLFRPIPYKKYQYIAIVLLTLFTLGIYGPMPKILWHILPGISLFRQWGYFALLLNLHAVIFMISFLRSFPKALSMILATLFLADSIGWGGARMGELSRAVHGVKPPYTLIQNEKSFVQFSLLERSVPAVALPRDWNPQGYAKLFEKRPFVSSERRGLEILPMDGGFTLRNRSEAPIWLGLFQHNDRQWRLSDSKREYLNPIDTSAGLFMNLEPNQTLQMVRPPSLWRLLITLMWIPLLLPAAGWLLHRFRFVVANRPHPLPALHILPLSQAE